MELPEYPEYSWEDVSRDENKKSLVWQHFNYNREHRMAKCNYCNKIISAISGVTTSMTRHLKAKHPTVL